MDASVNRPGSSVFDCARGWPVATAAFVIAVVGLLAIIGAWFFEFVVGLRPCPLCYEQRYPYYFAVPMAIMILLGDSVGSRRRVLLGALIAVAALMVWNTGLGVYHAGIEWRWWAGPQTCAGGAGGLGSSSGGGLLKDLASVTVIRCDEAAWRFMGISLAGYNALVAFSLAVVALWGCIAGWRDAGRD